MRDSDTPAIRAMVRVDQEGKDVPPEAVEEIERIHARIPNPCP